MVKLLIRKRHILATWSQWSGTALEPVEDLSKTRKVYRTFAIRGIGRKGVQYSLLSVIFAIGLTSCATSQYGRKPNGQAIIIEEPNVLATTPSPKPFSLTYLEGHRFTLPKEDSVVGSLGIIELRDGDTLSDVARHFGLGYEEIAAANAELDPWVIADGTKALVPLQFVLPRAPRRGIVINLAAMRLYHYPAAEGGAQVVTYPVGIGKEGRSTPTGAMSIAQKKEHPTWRPTQNILNDHLKRGDPLPAVVPPGPDNPLGDYAMYLTTPRYLIHGTNKPYSIGLRASNGCIRLYPENVEQLFPAVPMKEPVTIVNQPYLIGSRGGGFYLQAYKPHEEVDVSAVRGHIHSELKSLERDRNQSFDWQRIERILNEGRGIPFPISATMQSIDSVLADATPLAHPKNFFGQSPMPSEDPAAWHVLAADTASEMSARRMAGIMNHQGPPIPARVLLVGDRYQVVAGPFADAKAAGKAAKRLNVDLELESRVLAPETELAGTRLPRLAIPESAQLPVTTLPESSIPDTTTPGVSTPAEIVTPEIEELGTVTPLETMTPETGSMDATTWPEVTAPEAPASDVSLPNTTSEVSPAANEERSGDTNLKDSSPDAVTKSLDLTVPDQFKETKRANPPDDVPLESPPQMAPAPVDSKKPSP